MKILRLFSYLFMGFTFPLFWMYHAAGLWSFLYKPIQLLLQLENNGWPSFITAFLLYAAGIAVLELIFRLLKNAHP
ncbi:MAG: hypothetical protein CSA31_01950 [Desulfobulbus propionicus]|nr:MAG: hypothetical protein CSB34_06660 [Desulfobulbus propionicus]PIE60462.1 MAG: hypothetical protein CSA31_01950 [Desulfobulbus propionicus]